MEHDVTSFNRDPEVAAADSFSILNKLTTAADGGERVRVIYIAQTRSPPEFAGGTPTLIAIVFAGKLLWVAVKRPSAITQSGAVHLMTKE